MTELQLLVTRYFNPSAQGVPSATQAVIGRLMEGGELTEVCHRCSGSGRSERFVGLSRRPACSRCMGRGSVTMGNPRSKLPLQTRQCMKCASGKFCQPNSGLGYVLFDDAAGMGASPGCEACGWKGYTESIDAQPVHGPQQDTDPPEAQVDVIWAVTRWLRGLPYQERVAVEAYFSPRAVAWREGGGDSLAALLPLTDLGGAAYRADRQGFTWAGGLLALSLGQARKIQLQIFANLVTLKVMVRKEFGADLGTG